MASSVEERIVELERRLAFHERTGEELSGVVAAQARVIDGLTARVRRLLERVQALEASLRERSPQDDRPPPHY